MVVAGIAQAMVTKIGVKPVLLFGLALMALAMLWYTRLPVDGDYVTDLLPGYLLVGIGLPCAFIPVSIAALAGIRGHEAGLASGLINTTQQIGGAVGTAIASTVFTSRIEDRIAEGANPAGGVHRRLHAGVLADRRLRPRGDRGDAAARARQRGRADGRRAGRRRPRLIDVTPRSRRARGRGRDASTLGVRSRRRDRRRGGVPAVQPAAPHRRPALAVAAALGALVAAAFAVTLLLPFAGAPPVADALHVGDVEPSGRIVSLAWTGDGSRRVVVTDRGGVRSAVAVDRTGARRGVAGPLRGGLEVFPAPQGTRIAITRTRSNERTRVAVLDTRMGNEIWWRWTTGPTSVQWRADGTVTLAGPQHGCDLVRGSDGQLIEVARGSVASSRRGCP